MGKRQKSVNPMIGTKIKSLRQQHNMSQEDLAQKLKKSVSAIRMWEIGSSQPDSSTYVELAKLFHVSTDYLFALDDSATKEKMDIPVYDDITRGIDFENIKNITRIEQIRPSMAEQGGYIGLYIKNALWSPLFKKGDTIIIHRQKNADTLDYVVAFTDESETAMLRQIKNEDEGLWLMPINGNKQESIYYSDDDVASGKVQIFGRVVELRRPM